ncbi:MAG: hypothetical protein PVH24_04690, partial [Candidatus Zixiibacteriota bacterium]
MISSVGAAEGLLPEITVIYPKPDQVVTAIDSTFILGHLPADIPCKPSEAVLFINGFQVPVHPDGGFLAFLPINPGEFTFLLRAYRKEDIKNEGYLLEPAIAAGSLMVKVPEPQPKLRLDTLQIVGDFRPPPGDLVLTDGDMLDVSFRGTPGARAWFSIPGLVDSVPMAETPPRS